MSIPMGWTDPWESATWLDSRPFKEYAAAVEAIIFRGVADQASSNGGELRGLTTREIHATLGDAAKREWTADALDAIDSIEAVGILPTRYRPRAGAKPKLKLPKNQSMRWLFPSRR